MEKSLQDTIVIKVMKKSIKFVIQKLYMIFNL